MKEKKRSKNKYLRSGAMILTGMAFMYWTMFISSWEFSHVRLSQSRIFMAFTMGGTMGLIMFAWMKNMYKNTKINILLVLASILLFITGVALDRSQITVEDIGFMKGMVPHHSLAITRAERSTLRDVRVCELAYDISEAQRREIDEMDWLIKDIQLNGIAETKEEAASRPIPQFEVSPVRNCP